MFYLYHVNTFAYFELKAELTVGRTSGDMVYNSDFQMSGCHATITIDSSKESPMVYIEDLGSKNPTVLNRTQIYPHVKMRVKTYSLLEIGAQQFILTETKSMSLDVLNKVMDHNMNRPVVKIDRDVTSSIPSSSALDILGKTKLVQQAEEELMVLEQNAQAELMKLEQAKDKLMATVRSKKNELQKKLTVLKEDLENAHKLKAEVDNKKKVINIKSIG